MTSQFTDLVKATLNPRGEEGQTAVPPSLYTETSFLKTFDIAGNIAIGTDTNLINEKVPTQKGLIIWQPNRGLTSCYRMGMVPSGATKTSFQTAAGISTPVTFDPLNTGSHITLSIQLHGNQHHATRCDQHDICDGV